MASSRVRNQRTTGRFVLVLAMISAGCDPLYRTHQAVEVMVTSALSTQPVGGAEVEAAGKYYEGWNQDLPEPERNRAWLDQYCTGKGRTDATGRAEVMLKIQTVCGGVFPGIYPGFDPSVDRVTATSYLFRVSREGTTEILEVRSMAPGATARGENFVLGVQSIGKPLEDE